VTCDHCGTPAAPEFSYRHRFQNKVIHKTCFADLVDEQKGWFAIKQLLDQWDRES